MSPTRDLPSDADWVARLADIALYGVSLPEAWSAGAQEGVQRLACENRAPHATSAGNACGHPDATALSTAGESACGSAPESHAKPLVLRFLTAPLDETSAFDFAHVSAPTRNFFAECGAILARPDVMAVLAQGKWPKNGSVLMPLAPMPADQVQAFLAHLTPSAQKQVRSHITCVTEARRRALGLSAKLSSEQLHERIWLQGMAPALMARIAAHLKLDALALRCISPNSLSAWAVLEGAETGGAMVTHTPVLGAGSGADAAACNEVLCDVQDVRVPRFSANDPLSVNLAALAIRRGYFGVGSKTLQRFFNISPHGFGRRLAKQGQMQLGDVAVALAACQFSFLFLN